MFVKHPTMNEDGEIAIAGKRLPVRAGVFDWPDGVPRNVHLFKESAPPEALIRAKRVADLQAAKAELARLGLPTDAIDAEIAKGEEVEPEPKPRRGRPPKTAE